jgi:hypothetical protein
MNKHYTAHENLCIFEYRNAMKFKHLLFLGRDTETSIYKDGCHIQHIIVSVWLTLCKVKSV